MKICKPAIHSEIVSIGKEFFFNYYNFLSIISMNCLITIFIDLEELIKSSIIGAILF